MLAFHDADTYTDTDTDSPNTATILRRLGMPAIRPDPAERSAAANAVEGND